MVTTIEFTHHASTVDEIWDGLLTSTVRTAALITHQPEETRRRIREIFDDEVAAFREGDRFAIPISVKLVSGRKDSDRGGG